MQSKRDVGIKSIFARYNTDEPEGLFALSVYVYFGSYEEVVAFGNEVRHHPDNDIFYTEYYNCNLWGHKVQLRGINSRVCADTILNFLESRYSLPLEFTISYPCPKYSDKLLEITLPLNKREWLASELDTFLAKFELRNSAIAENLSTLIESQVNVYIVPLKAKIMLEITCLSSEYVKYLKCMVFYGALDKGVDTQFHFKSIPDVLGNPHENKFFIKINSGFNFHQLLEDLVSLKQTRSSTCEIKC